MTSISYCINVCNEKKDLIELIKHLEENITNNDEIVVTVDATNNTDKTIIDFLNSKTNIKTNYFTHNGNPRPDFRNFKIKHATKEYVFEIDPDERISKGLYERIQKILSVRAEMYWIPRVNIVKDLDENHANLFNYKLDEQDHINWPDYQGRLYVNNGSIRWEGDTHERPVGFKKSLALLQDKNVALIHTKTLKKELETYKNGGLSTGVGNE